MPAPFKDLTGQKFNHLTAVAFVGWKQVGDERKRVWLWRCDCGKEIECPAQYVTAAHARKSCGCIIGQHKRTHGATSTAEFRIWDAMRRRCCDPDNSNYPRYGGRGIRVCERWQKFENFFADMGPRPPGKTLDRKDNDGHYEPDNCRWATAREQSNNRRSNRRLTIQGVTKTYAEWEHDAGLKPGTVFVRLSQGWQGADVLLPSMRKKGASRVHPMRKRPARYLGEQHE